MGILAINTGHNGSVAYVNKKGELVCYHEEERLSKVKRDGNPFRAMNWIIEHLPVDYLIIGGTSLDLPVLPWTNENPYSALVRKYHPNVQTILMGHQHHLAHAACGFYNSGFDTAVIIVVDGSGSITDLQNNQGFETESVFLCGYPNKFELVYKNCFSNNLPQSRIISPDNIHFFTNAVTITKSYEAVSDYLGFGWIESGKTMGLAPYGKTDPNIPNFFVNGLGNKNLLLPYYPAGAMIDEQSNPYLLRSGDPTAWHNDKTQITDAAKNLAYKVQQETQEQVGNLIENAIKATQQKNVVITGGYALNCVANYYFLKRFPDLNFFIDPVAHDGGTSIGLALLHYYTQYQVMEPRPTITDLYLGTSASYNNLEFLVELNDLKTKSVTSYDVAELLYQNNIVGLFQGRSEAGPRALGNRSILYNPCDPNGKDKVNMVKHREWFRPFAATVLEERANDWFELEGLPDSSFMSYAVNVLPEKSKLVPAITHVDNTCRVQTVRHDQNQHYYDLISKFYTISGVPMLFNTSFNLAGMPLVDTLQDAVETFVRSDIPYLYLPEIKIILEKQ